MDALEQEVLLAKEDERHLNELIESRTPWILRCASDTVRRYVTTSDDEWSVALWAFAEAVRDYEPGKGKFLSFASVVIRRRLLDYLRGEKRREKEIPVSPEAFGGEATREEEENLPLLVRRKVAEDSAAAESDPAAQAREETGEMQAILSAYGFTFFALTECSPKAGKTREGCARAVRVLLADPALLAGMRKSRTLPMKELAAASGVSRKLLDRHRRYLIAAAEILSGDFPILSGYLTYVNSAG